MSDILELAKRVAGLPGATVGRVLFAAPLAEYVIRREEGVEVEAALTRSTSIGVCRCGEDTTGPNYCGHCGARLIWKAQ